MRAVWVTPSCASSALSDAALPSPTCCWKNRLEEASAVETTNKNARPARAYPAKRAKHLEKTIPHTAFQRISAEWIAGVPHERGLDMLSLCGMLAICILHLLLFISKWGRRKKPRGEPVKFFNTLKVHILYFLYWNFAKEHPVPHVSRIHIRDALKCNEFCLQGAFEPPCLIIRNPAFRKHTLANIRRNASSSDMWRFSTASPGDSTLYGKSTTW